MVILAWIHIIIVIVMSGKLKQILNVPPASSTLRGAWMKVMIRSNSVKFIGGKTQPDLPLCLTNEGSLLVSLSHLLSCDISCASGLFYSYRIRFCHSYRRLIEISY